MTVTGRKHNTDDIIATVLAVEPMKFIYRGRIAVFAIKVLRDERICVVAEQRPDCSEEEVLNILLKEVGFSCSFPSCQQFPVLSELPMDVSRSASRGLHPSSGSLLLGPGSSQSSPQDPSRWHSPVGDQAPICGRMPPSCKCLDVSSHVHYKLAETQRSPPGCW